MISQVTTEAVDRTALSAALEGVKSDAPTQQDAVNSNVEASLTDANSCMMGGWTAS